MYKQWLTSASFFVSIGKTHRGILKKRYALYIIRFRERERVRC